MGPILLVIGGLILAASFITVDQDAPALALLLVGLSHKPAFWFFWLILTTIATTIKFVRQQEVLVIERLGRYNRTLTAGIQFIIPIIESVAYTFDLRERVIDVTKQEAITKDNATVTIDGVLYYKIVNGKDAAYGTQDITRAIINLAQTSMRSAIGSMELDKTFENRSEINERVVRAVSDAAQLWGAHVTRYEIKDIALPESLRKSMEQQMKAERDKRAAVLESEGIRQSQVNRAEGKKQAAILEAEGQAKAIELVRTQMDNPNSRAAVEIELAKKALDAYGNIAKTGNTIVLTGENADPAGWLAKALAVLPKVQATANSK